MPWILKLVARILKSEPLIFSLLRRGVNVLKISFHFLVYEKPFPGHVFRVAACLHWCVAVMAALSERKSQPGLEVEVERLFLVYCLHLFF